MQYVAFLFNWNSAFSDKQNNILKLEESIYFYPYLPKKPNCTPSESKDHWVRHTNKHLGLKIRFDYIRFDLIYLQNCLGSFASLTSQKTMVIYWVAGSVWTVTCGLAVGQKKWLILHHVSTTNETIHKITLPLWKYVSLGSVVTCSHNLSLFKGCQRVTRVSVWEGERRTLRCNGTFLWTFYFCIHLFIYYS